MQDYVPGRSQSARKENQTKRERWQRLVNDPAAEQMMWDIYQMEKETWHMDSHSRGSTDCRLPWCEYWNRLAAEQAFTARRLLIDELNHQFCKRFAVTIGYRMRFRSRIIYKDVDEFHARERAERFTEDDRQALGTWLSENP